MEKQNRTIDPMPLQVKIKDLEGREHTFTALTITRKNAAQFNEDISTGALKLPVAEQIYHQFSVIYGPADLDNFDVRAIKAAVFAFMDDQANPKL